jgi:hypothetical protein
LQQLRPGLPVRRAQDEHGDEPDDEVRHVLRPHFCRQEADVRIGVPEPGALLRHSRGDRGAATPLAARRYVPLRRPDDHDQGST